MTVDTTLNRTKKHSLNVFSSNTMPLCTVFAADVFSVECRSSTIMCMNGARVERNGD